VLPVYKGEKLLPSTSCSSSSSSVVRCPGYRAPQSVSQNPPLVQDVSVEEPDPLLHTGGEDQSCSGPLDRWFPTRGSGRGLHLGSADMQTMFVYSVDVN